MLYVNMSITYINYKTGKKDYFNSYSFINLCSFMYNFCIYFLKLSFFKNNILNILNLKIINKYWQI